MPQTLIFLPAVAMVLLTVLVTVAMFFERKRQIVAGRISFRDIPSSSQIAARLTDTRAVDNYRNLFEAPVLFYLGLVVAFASAQVSLPVLLLAWSYVALRYLHSAIHCTYNRTRHRFYAFLASNLVLWILWGVLCAGLLRG